MMGCWHQGTDPSGTLNCGQILDSLKKKLPASEFVLCSMELVSYMTIGVGSVPVQGDVARFAWWGLMCVCMYSLTVSTLHQLTDSTLKSYPNVKSRRVVVICVCWKYRRTWGYHNNIAVYNQLSIAGVVLIMKYACSQTSCLQMGPVNTRVQ